jgi:hypothetical protein
MAEPGVNEVKEPESDGLVSLALRSVLMAVLLGTAAMAMVLWSVGRVVAAAPSPAPDPNGLAFNLLLAGWIMAPALTGVLAWQLLRPVDSAFRRGGLSLVAAFSTVVLSFLAAPLHYRFGQAGLLALAAAAAILALLLSRRPRATP